MSTSNDPWMDFAGLHRRGDKLRLKVSEVVPDLGLFCALNGGIYGIVHLSDIDWLLPGHDAVLRYSVGDVIDGTVLAIDVERQRVSLGIKQLKPRPGDNKGDSADPAPVAPGPRGPRSQSTGAARERSKP